MFGCRQLARATLGLLVAIGAALPAHAGLIASYGHENSDNRFQDDTGNGHTLVPMALPVAFIDAPEQPGFYYFKLGDTVASYSPRPGINDSQQRGLTVPDAVYPKDGDGKGGSFTFSALVYKPWADGSPGSNHTILSSSRFRFQRLRDTQRLYMSIRGDSGTNHFSGTSGSFLPNDWYFVALRYDEPANSLKAFLQGASDVWNPSTLTIASVPEEFNDLTNFTLGVDYSGIGGRDGFDGMIDGARFYTTALSDAELEALFFQFSVPEPSTFVLLLVGLCGLLVRRNRLPFVACAALVACMAPAGTASAGVIESTHVITHGGTSITMLFVHVGHPGNDAASAANTEYDAVEYSNAFGYGTVDYIYDIGKYHVTNAQYAAFLNAVASESDPHGLYHLDMGTHATSGISREGTAGNYTYTVREEEGVSRAQWPVNYVSWYAAARFTNWLTTGDTESGVYNTGNWESMDRQTALLTFGAAYFLPSENEWYKAAYYDPAGNDGEGRYYLYGTGTDEIDTSMANYYGATYGGESGGTPSDVGSYEYPSPYGAYDMAGNVWQWNEARSGSNRGRRGSWYGDAEQALRASNRGWRAANSPNFAMGFRVASVPEPGSVIMLLAGVVGLLLCRRR
ncbi:MAG: SUMF1/EgtB/PvdO family nonheme iron enzyme [Thermoguttaceae bacterium]|jgi:formylglycine-generating enzyme required for sulfatase activity|nr:SUMF1/EgtB/PvdO family nonheme iron enzyme [Thermoguttaceae bacterium]